MSVQAISWVLERSEATGAARLVLISIANHASHDGDSCWPSVATIARESLLAERTVQIAFRELESLKELRIERGTGRGNTHNFFLPKYQEWVQTIRLLDKRAQSTATKGAEVAPEPSLTVIKREPSEETCPICDKSKLLCKGHREKKNVRQQVRSRSFEARRQDPPQFREAPWETRKRLEREENQKVVEKMDEVQKMVEESQEEERAILRKAMAKK